MFFCLNVKIQECLGCSSDFFVFYFSFLGIESRPANLPCLSQLILFGLSSDNRRCCLIVKTLKTLSCNTVINAAMLCGLGWRIITKLKSHSACKMKGKLAPLAISSLWSDLCVRERVCSVWAYVWGVGGCGWVWERQRERARKRMSGALFTQVSSLKWAFIA